MSNFWLFFCHKTKKTSTLIVIFLFIYISCKHSTLNMNVSLVKGMFNLYKTQKCKLLATLHVNAEMEK